MAKCKAGIAFSRTHCIQNLRIRRMITDCCTRYGLLPMGHRRHFKCACLCVWVCAVQIMVRLTPGQSSPQTHKHKYNIV